MFSPEVERLYVVRLCHVRDGRGSLNLNLTDHILNTSVKQFSTALRKKCGPQFLHFIFWVSLADKVKLVLY